MESIYSELTLYGIKNECERTDNVLFPISEFCDGTVSLLKVQIETMNGFGMCFDPT